MAHCAREGQSDAAGVEVWAGAPHGVRRGGTYLRGLTESGGIVYLAAARVLGTARVGELQWGEERRSGVCAPAVRYRTLLAPHLLVLGW